jgi:hypothetical protein
MSVLSISGAVEIETETESSLRPGTIKTIANQNSKLIASSHPGIGNT